MTVSSNTSTATFIGNGATVFPLPFRFFDNDDLQVFRIDPTTGQATQQALGVDYSLSGAGEPEVDGSPVSVLTLTSPLTLGGPALYVERIMAIEQPTDIVNQGRFFPEVHEDAFDRTTMLIQQADATGRGAIRVAIGDPEPARLPPATSRANLLLSFDSDGEPTAIAPANGSVADFAINLANNADPSKGASLVGYRGRTLRQHLEDEINVKDFGVVGDGVTDDTAAIQSLINSAGTRKKIFFPAGSYKITGTITIDKDRVHLIGAGSWATQILFVPTLAGSCFKCSAGAAVLYQGSIKGFSFFSTETTLQKTAIEIIDTSGYALDDIVVSGSLVASGSSFWGGSNSRGLWLKGREVCSISRLYIFADRAIEISGNPNHSIDIDHFNFNNCYLASNGNPIVSVNDGVNLTNVTFDGYQAWVLGTDGFKWIDTTTAGVSQTLVFENVRFEQGTSAAAWCIDIQHNSNLQGLTINNCQGGTERNGYRLRKVVNAHIANNINPGGVGRTNLDVDSTVQGLHWENCFWQVGATSNINGQRLVYAEPVFASNSLAPTASYQSTATSAKGYSTELANNGYTVTVANNGIIALGDNTMGGMLTVVDSEYLSAIYNIRGTLNAVSEVADPSGVFTPTAGSATSTNIYWSAANSRYELQNLRGATRRYRIILDGTYTAF